MSETAPPIEGTWQMLRAETGGEPAPELVARQTTLELSSGEYRVRFAGQIADCGGYELSAVMGGRTITLRGSSGPNAGRTIAGIYQLQGDLLRVCFGMDGIAPTEFTTANGDPRYLATYRRLVVSQT